MAPVTEALVAALDPQPHDLVLDLAGGTGDLVEALAGRAARIIATDLSPVMVDAARRRAIAKLRELESIGVDQFNIYLMTHGQEEVLQAYGSEILPRFSQVTA